MENQREFNESVLSQLKDIRKSIKQLRMMSSGIVDMHGAAEILGIKISNIYVMTSRNEIPFHKPRNKKIYFVVDELREWVVNNKKEHGIMSLKDIRAAADEKKD